jgi:hypothetical protein
MARTLRIEYPVAIRHVLSRGNLRRYVFLEDRDYQRLLEELSRSLSLDGMLAFTHSAYSSSLRNSSSISWRLSK